MFVHHVLFWLKPGSGYAERTEFVEGLATLGTIDLVKTCHIGTPGDTDRPVIDRSYDYSLLTIFDSAADEQSYQSDPTHLAFINSCKHLWEKVLIYDSEDL